MVLLLRWRRAGVADPGCHPRAPGGSEGHLMIPNVTGDSLPGLLSDEQAKSEQSMSLRALSFGVLYWIRCRVSVFSFRYLWAAARGRRPPSFLPPFVPSFLPSCPASFFYSGLLLPPVSSLSLSLCVAGVSLCGKGPWRMGICVGIKYSYAPPSRI